MSRRRLAGAAVGLLLVLVTGCHQQATATLTVTPTPSAVDQPVSITVRGPATAHVTITARATDAAGRAWQSHASFIADAAGTVDTARERIQDPVIAICGEQDQLWASCPFSETIIKRLADHGRPYARQLLSYPVAGHGVGGLFDRPALRHRPDWSADLRVHTGRQRQSTRGRLAEGLGLRPRSLPLNRVSLRISTHWHPKTEAGVKPCRV